MDLIAVKQYMQERKIVALQDIAMHFNVEMSTVRPLLDIWIKKGKATKIADASSACKCCSKCDKEKIETYQWMDS